VPYKVVAPDASTIAPLVEETAVDAAMEGVAPAILAPAHATRWELLGAEREAPAGTEFAMAIAGDFDADGRPDALAAVQPISDAGAGEVSIVYYVGTSLASVVVPVPARAADVSCSPVVNMDRIGDHTAVVSLGTRCPHGESSRALSVVRLAKEATLLFSLGVVDPSFAPPLLVSVATADRDRDGVDDVALRVTLSAGGPPFEPGPSVAANVVYFDRPAGPSRDPSEPEASFRTLSAGLAARAANGKEAPQVPGHVQQLRALYRALCTEGGAPRLVRLDTGAGARMGAIACGASAALEEAGVAETRAFVTQADALRAVVAAALAQFAPATKSSKRTTELTALLGRVAPFVDARDTRVLAVTVPPSAGPHPAWGPLAFESSSKLLVRGTGSVVRVDLASFEEGPAEIAAWPSQVLAPGEQSRWLEAYHACEGVALRATFAPTGSEGEMRELLLPVAPRLGARCVDGRGEAASAVPLAWGPRGLEALVAGIPLLLRPEANVAVGMASMVGQSPPLGSARSPSGAAMALATAEGVLVIGKKSQRCRAPELEPYAELSACTVNDEATRIACTKRGRVVVAMCEPR
jgi:hypothetical protein